MQVLLANPRGFCAGVDRAIDIVERALELFGAPIYGRHEVVHNRYVVDRLRGMGAIFVEELRDVPQGATVIFSAHGVSTAVEEEARARRLTVFNATCPLVTKVHMEVQRYAREGRDVILIGHAGHPEIEGTLGRFDPSAGGVIHLVQSASEVASLRVRDPLKLAFVTQTTLSVDDTAEIVAALKARSRSAMCCWWWDRVPAPIQTACGSSPTAQASPATSSMARRTSSVNGLRASAPSA